MEMVEDDIVMPKVAKQTNEFVNYNDFHAFSLL